MNNSNCLDGKEVGMDYEDISNVSDENASADNVLPEPEIVEEDALMKFNKQWFVKLEAKRAKEFEHEKAQRANAAEDLANWTAQRDIRLSAKKDSNRTEEHVLMEAIDSEAVNLKTWDRVTKLIEVADAVDNKCSDTGRMRKLFIQLKNEPLEVSRAAASASTN